jgi:hypothetical protein
MGALRSARGSHLLATGTACSLSGNIEYSKRWKSLQPGQRYLTDKCFIAKLDIVAVVLWTVGADVPKMRAKINDCNPSKTMVA